MKEMKTALIMVVVVISLLTVSSASCDSIKCLTCHDDIAENFSTSLHHNAHGMFDEYETYAMDHFGLDTAEYYEQKNCQKCHIQTCTQCHIGTYEGAHNEKVDTDVCEKCHGKKQSSTYVGDFPMHKKPGPNADVHSERGLVCTDCHTPDEMHGDGNYYATQLEAVKVDCKDCHEPHDETHETLDCNACHTGWLLTCNSCHIETRKGMTVSSEEFYLAKDKDGMVSSFMKMETMATIANNDTHTIYAEWHAHTTTPEGKDCDFCHNDSSIYVSDDTIFGGEGGTGFTQEEIDKIMNAEIPTEPEPGIGIIETIQNWIQSLMG